MAAVVDRCARSFRRLVLRSSSWGSFDGVSEKMTPATSRYELAGETTRSSPGTARHVMVADDDEILLLPVCVPDATGPARFSALGMVPRLLLAAVLTSPVMFFNPE